MIANFFNKPNFANKSLLMMIFVIIYAISVNFEIVVFNWFTVFLIGFYFVFINLTRYKNRLTFSNSFTLLFLIILTGFFPKVLVTDNIFWSNLVLAFALDKIYSLQFFKNISKKVFDASFLIGISFLIEPISVVFLGFLYTAIFLHNKSDIRNVIIPFIGFFVPVFLFFTFCFWFDQTEQFTNLFFINPNFDFTPYKSLSFLYRFIFILIFTIGAVIIKTYKLISIITSFRVSWWLIVLNFILASIIVIFSSTRSGSELLYLFFPISIILTNGLEVLKNYKTTDGILILFFISLLIPFLI